MPLNVDNLKTKVITVGENVESTGCYSSIGGGLNNTSLTDFSVLAGGLNNTITTSSNYYTTGCNTISGGYRNTITGISCASTISGGRYNTTTGRSTTIGGGRDNQSGTEGFVDGSYGLNYGGTLNNSVWEGPFSPSSGSTLSGYGAEFSFYFNGGGSVSIDIINGGSGYKPGDVLLFNGNLFSGGTTPTDNLTFSVYTDNYDYATVGGGRENTASGEYSTISGGYENTALGYASTISGGYQNEVRCGYSTISGGYHNTVLECGSTISGGYENTISGYYSTIVGGCNNTISNVYNSSILGGRNNTSTHDCGFIAGNNISTVAQCTLHVNCLHFSNIPTSSAGLAAGTVWSDSGMLCIV